MADTIVTSMRFKNDQYSMVKEAADFQGLSVTAYMRQAILERVEDEEDYRDGIARLKESDGVIIESDDVEKMLGLDE